MESYYRPALHREGMGIGVGCEVRVWESSNRWSEDLWIVTGMLIVPGEPVWAEVKQIKAPPSGEIPCRCITLRHLTPADRPLPWRPAEPTVWV